LIRAKLNRMLADIDLAIKAALAAEGPEPGRFGRALVRGSLGDATKASPQRLALLAAVASNPMLLAGQSESYKTGINCMMGEGLDFEVAAIVSLATDGLWLLELIGISSFTPEERQWIVDALCRLATQSNN
jgi:Tetracyclin repressor-like, C-terminal domain